ncbi:CobW/HypB/UreG, nucleotide-binding domain-containing protein [Lineolata rhizophorae]|uniref:CobW/HypB/UreG, nucleotide-binding domain-containing protein n=1 Tax=Lineolata rhizophorae TaxID=578093 RepID=A0A6A6NT52_9PEZI|nr:CobW/HypB/UreG, nucleotide-binding domain-containing protein [Lineolata rhizophorae]
MPVPITILTGFLGSGKTTLLLNLIPQLPQSYRLALLKNEFGDVAVDSQLASQRAISGVQELLNGCICCNLVGQLGDALEQLRTEVAARGGGGGPDRIVIETSGSAFPATLAMEVNRLAADGYLLDGVVSVVDAENWTGYADTSYTAKLQARYTDLVVLNKWEDAGERRVDDVLDRLGDLEVPTAVVRSDRGRVDVDVLFGLDAKLVAEGAGVGGHAHHHHDHQSEVEVLSVTFGGETGSRPSLNLSKLAPLLSEAPREEVYRMKAVLQSSDVPTSSDGQNAAAPADSGQGLVRYVLNWAFGRWTYTSSPAAALEDAVALRMTVVTARGEANTWKRELQRGGFLELHDMAGDLKVERVD